MSAKRRFSHFIFFVVSILLIFSLANCKPQKKYTLKLNLQEGKTYFMRLETKQDLEMQLMGAQRMEQTMNIGATYEVEKVNEDGTIEVKFTYNDVATSQNSPAGSYSYDSKNDGSNAPDPLKPVAVLVGKSIGCTFTDTGQVVEVRGIKKLVDSMMASLELPEGPMKEQFESQIKAQFGEEALTQMIKASMDYMPLDPVSLGQTWRKDTDFASAIPLTLRNSYKLSSIEGNLAVITVKSDVSSNPDASMSLGYSKVEYNIAGTQMGSYDIELDSGMATRGSRAQDITGSMTVGGPGTGPMTVPLKIKTEITYSVIAIN